MSVHRKRINRYGTLLFAGVALGLSVVGPAPAQETREPATKPDEPTQQPEAKNLPKAEKLMAQFMKAMGGETAFKDIDSTHTKATMEMPMNQGTLIIESFWKRPDLALIKQEMPGRGTMEIGYNGEIGWQNAPGMGYQLMPESQIEDMRGQVNMHMKLAELGDDFETVETVDETSFQGSTCYKVKMTNPAETEGGEPQETFAFFDAETSLLAGMEMTQQSMRGPMTITLAFKDWKEDEETGLMLYHSMVMTQMGMNMNIEYTEMTFNNVDPSVFKAPEEVVKMAEARKTEEEAKESEESSDEQEGEAGEQQGAPSASDLTEEQRQAAENMLASLMKQEDPAQLNMIAGVLKGQISSASEEEKPVLRYIVKRIEERIKELESGSGGSGSGSGE
jgi:hypothetical protein